MDQSQPTPKQLVVERLKSAANILVTVSANPSVDQLAAAIGFTVLLNKLDKHATAVFSGQIPNTLEFLQPEATLERDTNSLRDFIISLDKSKADKLRYKVEENVVRIYITPYRTSLSQQDLDFSQGDFNVDAVVALGVSESDHLDAAIMAHGRILHDATVISITAGPLTSEMGAINWQDPAASSLCEMLVSISEAFQGGLLDAQIATAFLTGIVAETERFSNAKTSPKVMTMSAQLMAAGANQQLIATKLQQTFMPHEDAAPTATPGVKAADDGSLSIKHQPETGEGTNPSQSAVSVGLPATPPNSANSSIHIDEHGNFHPTQEDAMALGIQLTPDGLPKTNTLQAKGLSGGNSSGDEQRRKVIEPLNTKPKPAKPPTDLKKLVAEDVARSNAEALGLGTGRPDFSGIPEAVIKPSPELADEDMLRNQAPLSQPAPAIDAFQPPPQPQATSLPQIKEPASQPTPSPLPELPAEVVEDEAPAERPGPGFTPAPPRAEPAPEPALSLPAISDTQTLTQIEETVHSPHITHHDAPLVPAADPTAESAPAGVDAARDAVLQAISAAPLDTTRPEPVAALNALPLGGITQLPIPTSDSDVEPDLVLPPSPVPQNPTAQAPADTASANAGQAPPPVPPPLMSFPLPPQDKQTK